MTVPFIQGRSLGPSSELNRFSMVGSGALGKALCRALCGLGLKLDQLVSRSPRKWTGLDQRSGVGDTSKVGCALGYPY